MVPRVYPPSKYHPTNFLASQKHALEAEVKRFKFRGFGGRKAFPYLQSKPATSRIIAPKKPINGTVLRRANPARAPPPLGMREKKVHNERNTFNSSLYGTCLSLSQATLILPALTIGGGALAGLALLKAAAIKGDIGITANVSINDFESVLLSASQHDASDCAKKLVCEVSGLTLEDMNSEETMIARLFNPDQLDVAKATVEFDLAAQIGKRVGIQQCSIIYERCPHSRRQLIDIFRDPRLGNEF
ncbi:unnamed protein product [Lepeophtheirus salmonis]|uniref:(salmon louse) hypothetical protein n=1 Tax=Lepeophtheirus salmonis TaxID=72036 RepID=A0A7R8HED6_LEPSM|nr:unnamed protein product [Lepeophtheirus salmonis]CAF3042668.1 unnamed protein product [Lepeophtheirus salmonis]